MPLASKRPPMSPATRWSVLALLCLVLACLAVGFLWLPSVQADFRAASLWDSICRAAGVPGQWSAPSAKAPAPVVASNVVLLPAMSRPAPPQAVGRGATLALACTMCHGVQGHSRSDAPGLAGQFPEVIIKQLADYRSGKRSSAVMGALARTLSERDAADLAAYFASLPRPAQAGGVVDSNVPRLVQVGDPLRNIAPCISCHGGADRKIGAPWLDGLPRHYLAEQLALFKRGERANDAMLQMRNVAHAMREDEISAIADYYARAAGQPF